VTDLDQSTPLSADQLRGLESMCAALHGASETDPVVKEVAWRTFALISAHREQCSDVTRLTETAYHQARMIAEITDACVAAEGDALRHRTQVAELSAEVARLTSERDRAVAAAEHMGDAMEKVGPALLEALRLAAAGDAASAAAVLGDVAPEGAEGGETGD
jgi:hypothetical protein